MVVSFARRLAATDDDAAGAAQQEGSDDPQLEEACLFLAVLACLVCCCFSTCIVRRLRRASGYMPRTELTQPLLDDTDHEVVFRSDGRAPWACPVCALENKARTAACDICGLTKAAAISHGKDLSAKARHSAGFSAQVVDGDDKQGLSGRKAAAADVEAGDGLVGLSARQRRAARRNRWERAVCDGAADLLHPEVRLEGEPRLVWRLAKGAFEDSTAKGCVRPVVVDLLATTGESFAAPPGGAAASCGCVSQSLVAKYPWSTHDERATAARRAARGRDNTHDDDGDDAMHGEARELRPRMAAGSRMAAGPRARRLARLEELVAVSARPFSEKHLWFEQQAEALRAPPSEGYVRLEVRRGCLLEDSLQQMLGLESAALRQWMRVQFVDEPGIDVGGLEREWFQLAAAAVFERDVGVFGTTASGEFMPEAAASLPEALGGHPRARDLYEFAGRLIGKALLEHVPLNVPLALPIYKLLLGAPLEFADLELVDADLFRNVEWLVHHDAVEDLDLDFSVAVSTPHLAASSAASALLDAKRAGDVRALNLAVVRQEAWPADGEAPQGDGQPLVVRELAPGGRNVRVDRESKLDYVAALWRHHAYESTRDAVWHIARGLYAVVPPEALSVFDAHELELLLCGSRAVDVEDWAAHTEYAGEFRRRGVKHAVIGWFWRTVKALRDDERARLLQFCTGSSRVPCHGFRALQRNDGRYQRFCIQSLPRAALRFPRAHTCFNRLDLPMYSSRDELDAGIRMLIALDATGFTMD
ncbi:hypothetical protein M885DRAFT_625869 [Pelagophyceae sp. CCMP2097]|nr:hypothetical protein M885DRAFT_625869 [Pelagophyceae sp. CCMP2097]|mmetsp:Transcript_9863/g.34057  ORF Transcript_9863/g.34057 Transcript_9863/m.34057 type:complete len:761 (+) Transcript_9863:76-2358(+)